MRDALIFHIVSGQALFSGAALIVAGALLPPRSPRRFVKFGRAVAVWLGLLLAIASATPLPIAYYAAAIGATLAWLLGGRWNRAHDLRSGRLRRAAMIGVWCLGGQLNTIPPYSRAAAAGRAELADARYRGRTHFPCSEARPAIVAAGVTPGAKRWAWRTTSPHPPRPSLRSGRATRDRAPPANPRLSAH